MLRTLLGGRSRAGIAARAAAICMVAGVIAGARSCGGTTSSTVTATGTTLKIYTSVPAADSGSADVLAAERLALEQAGGQVNKFRVALIPLTGAKISDNARAAISDESSIAYVGELGPAASRASVGITNALDLLQVAPGDTALELTQATGAVPGAPGDYYESLKSYGRTFARVVPSTALEAKAQVQEMQALGVGSLYVTDDGSQYGAALALAVKSAAGAAFKTLQGPPTAAAFRASGASALFDGADDQNGAAAARLLGTVGEQDGSVQMFVPSSLATAAFAARLGGANVKLYASAPGFLRKDLTPLGEAFQRNFQSRYGHAPSPQAIFGYEAVRAVFDVLREAGGRASDRTTVVRDFFSIKNRSSALGTYSIDANGDTTLGPFVFSRFHSGRFVPFKFVEVQG